MDNKLTCSGPVFVVEDDSQMSEFIAAAVRPLELLAIPFGSAEEFLESPPPNGASCLIIDIALPGMNGLALCREVMKREYPCAVVFFSGCADVAISVEAMKLGASDFLQKPCTGQRIREVVQVALNESQKLFDEHCEEEVVINGLASLTRREREILLGISEGMLTKEIAKRLGISHRTVDVHRSHLMDKLDVESPTQLAHVICIMQRRQTRLDLPHTPLRLLYGKSPSIVNMANAATE